MIKANKFFFLSAVADHIVADFRRFDNKTLISFKHEEDKSGDALNVEIVQVGKSYIIDYSVLFNNSTLTSAKSDPIPQDQIYGVIAGIANEVILK